MAQTSKTDNSFLASKIMLRARHLPVDPVRVLDCYAGTGLIWDGVTEYTGRAIKVLPIDKRKDISRFRLPGDNTRYLRTLDLAPFNVIDLDAYGIPFSQLETVFDRKWKGTVFVTFIQTMFGQLPSDLLAAVGFSDAQREKIPTLLGMRGWQYFAQWLASRGVRKIHHMSHSRSPSLSTDTHVDMMLT
jgi:hypothetical protein